MNWLAMFNSEIWLQPVS
uniref:Uncharacterized protein n=1 Tax=Arundo donax TaxID=35708 RepID=A0A0A8YGQ1_ARUDO